MTEVEAFEIGNKLYANITSNANNIIETNDYIEFVRTANKALEKQIRKKPIQTDSYRGILKRIYAYACPTCGNVCLEKYINERQNTTFCWDCGQKLDWSDEQ